MLDISHGELGRIYADQERNIQAMLGRLAEAYTDPSAGNPTRHFVKLPEGDSVEVSEGSHFNQGYTLWT
jgi:hypothetical protein